MTTSAEIEYSPDVARAAPLLPRAAAVISDPLIRNRATLGGSLAEADPHGDWPPVILAVDATVHLHSRDGERAVPASEFFTMDGDGRGSKRTALRPGELLTAVTVPAADARTRSTYLKRMHPASGHAMLGVAVVATFDADETCRECRIAITGTATIATRATRAEDRLTGSRLTLTPSKPRRRRQTTESRSPATHSAPPPIWPSCFRSTSAEPCRRSRSGSTQLKGRPAAIPHPPKTGVNSDDQPHAHPHRFSPVNRLVIDADAGFDDLRGRYESLVPDIDMDALTVLIEKGDLDEVRRYTAERAPHTFARFWTFDPHTDDAAGRTRRRDDDLHDGQ